MILGLEQDKDYSDFLKAYHANLELLKMKMTS